jgi:tetratricopeptide (TPR) repeat protein
VVSIQYIVIKEKKMGKKKMLEHVGAIAIIGVFAFLALGSGTLDNTRSTSGTGSWILNWENDHKTSLGQYEIVYKDNHRSMPEPLNAPDLFGRVNWFISILDVFDLQDKLSMEQKLELFDALFHNIPGKTQDEGYRIVSLGKFVGDKSLQFVLGAVKLNDKAPPGTHGLQIYSNCMITRTNEGKQFIITQLTLGTLNWDTLGVVFPDGRVVRANNLHDEEEIAKWKEESGGDETLLAINLSDLFIKDEIRENDAEAFAMLEKAIAAPSSGPASDIVLRLNYFLCLLSANRIDEAEKTLAEATELYQNVSDPDLGLKSAVEWEAPAMLAIYRSTRQQH